MQCIGRFNAAPCAAPRQPDSEFDAQSIHRKSTHDCSRGAVLRGRSASRLERPSQIWDRAEEGVERDLLDDPDRRTADVTGVIAF